MSVVAIVGSMRFRAYMDEIERSLIREGKTPIAPTAAFEAYRGALRPHDKAPLDALHIRKLNLCNEMFVVDVGGYIGQSTAREITAFKEMGKPISYLSDGDSDCPGCRPLCEHGIYADLCVPGCKSKEAAGDE